GTVSFTTSTGRVRRVPVTGTGARPGLYAVPGTLAFPFAPDQGLTDVPVGISVTQLVDVINGGGTIDRVTSVTPPATPFPPPRPAGSPPPPCPRPASRSSRGRRWW